MKRTLCEKIKEYMYINDQLDSQLFSLSNLVANRDNEVKPILICGSKGTGKTEIINLINEYYKENSVFITIEKIYSREHYLEVIRRSLTSQYRSNKIDIICIDDIHIIGEFYSYLINLNKNVREINKGNIIIIATCNKKISVNYIAYFNILNIREYPIEDKILIVDKISKRIAKNTGIEFEVTSGANTELNLFHRMSLGVSKLESDINNILKNKITGLENNHSIRIEKNDVTRYFNYKDNFLYSINNDFKIGISNALTRNLDFNLQLKIEAKLVYKDMIDSYIFGEFDNEALDAIKISSYSAISFLSTKGIKIPENMNLIVNCYGVDSLKKGPSCGLAVLASCMSAITNIPIYQDIGFSGYVNLHGEVIRVGNICEKVIQAYNRGIKRFYIPSQNRSDIEEIPSIVRDNIIIELVENIEKLYNMLFMCIN
jgi:ATP-dependent Lon protease